MADRDDRQQDEVYAAERAVDWGAFNDATDNLGELEDVWEWTYKLMRSAKFARRYPRTHNNLGRRKMVAERQTPWGGQVYVQGRVVDKKGLYGTASGLIIRPKARGGCANANEMDLSRWARQKWIVIHELAHVVDHNENGVPWHIWHQGHGWQFCRIYLTLVNLAFGYEAEKALRASFKAHGEIGRAHV